MKKKVRIKDCASKYFFTILGSSVILLSLCFQFLRYKHVASNVSYSIKINGYDTLTLVWDSPFAGFGAIFYFFTLAASFLLLIYSIIMFFNSLKVIDINYDLKKIDRHKFLYNFTLAILILGILTYLFYLVFVLIEQGNNGSYHQIGFFAFFIQIIALIQFNIVKFFNKLDLK